MVYLAQSQYLLLLLFIPLLFVAYALYLRVRRKRIARLGNPEGTSKGTTLCFLNLSRAS